MNKDKNHENFTLKGIVVLFVSNNVHSTVCRWDKDYFCWFILYNVNHFTTFALAHVFFFCTVDKKWVEESRWGRLSSEDTETSIPQWSLSGDVAGLRYAHKVHQWTSTAGTFHHENSFFFSSWTSIFPPLQMRLIILGLCLAALWDVFPVGHASERKPTEHFWIFIPCLTHFNGRRMLSSSSHRAETSLKCPVASVSSRHHVQIMSEGDDRLRNVGQEFRALGWKTRLWNCDAKAVVWHHEVTINLTLPCHRYVTAVFSAAASSSWTSSTSSPPKTSGGVRPPRRTKNTLKTLKTVDWVGFTNGDNVVK